MKNSFELSESTFWELEKIVSNRVIIFSPKISKCATSSNSHVCSTSICWILHPKCIDSIINTSDSFLSCHYPHVSPSSDVSYASAVIVWGSPLLDTNNLSVQSEGDNTYSVKYLSDEIKVI